MITGVRTGQLGELGELGELVEGLSVEPVSAEVVAVFAVRDRFEARVLEALAGFFATGGHDVDGFRSAVGWLKANVAVTDGEAKALAARARRLAVWPTLARLFYEGSLSSAQVAVVVSLVPNSLVELYADHDEEISALLVGLGVGATRDAIAAWVSRAEDATSPDPAEVVDPENPVVDGFVHLSRFGADDRGRVDGELGPDATMTIDRALDAATRPDAKGEFRVASQRRAEALVEVCAFYTAHVDCEHPRRPRTPQVVVVIDLADLYKGTLAGLGIRTGDDLERFLRVRSVSAVEEGFLREAFAYGTGRATTLDGHRLSPEAVTTIFGAGTTLERLMLAEGRVLDHGRQVRLVTGSLRDAMIVRDRGCRFPSPTGERCDAPVAWIDGHHISRWRDGGVTSLDNAVALCSSHHGVVHRDGWSMTTEPDGTLTVTRPDGTVLTSPSPRRTRPPQLPLRHPGPAVRTHRDPSDPDECDPDTRPGHGQGHEPPDDGLTCAYADPVPRITARLPERDVSEEAEVVHHAGELRVVGIDRPALQDHQLLVATDRQQLGRRHLAALFEVGDGDAPGRQALEARLVVA